MSRRLERMSGGGGAGGGGTAAPNVPPIPAPRSPPTQQQELQQQRRREQGLTEWKALLCTLIADREVKSLRHDAKRLLRRLCVTQVGVW